MKNLKLLLASQTNYHLSRKEKNLEFTHYYGKHKRRNNYVLQKNTTHKSKTFQFRADNELKNYIQNLSKELNQSDSKTIKDILEDSFLEQKLKNQKEEIKDFLERA